MRRRLLPLLILLAGYCIALPRQAVADPVPEYAMKAAFLYNFALFTEWPEEVDGSFNLCVLGRDPFGMALESFEGKPLKQARLTILRIATVDNASIQAKQCHLLYVSEPESALTRKVFIALRNTQVLTVTDTDNLLESGAMIGMRLEGKHLVFDINYTAAQRSRLILSSKMLQLARKVY